MTLDERIQSEFAASREIQGPHPGDGAAEQFHAAQLFRHQARALEEAMINAIKHGNKLDVSKHVHIKVKVGPRVAEIMIEDEGPGFVRHEVPDPTAIENLEKCSGRGIMLIEAYMNDVEWTNKGRRLKMCKRNGEEAGR